MWSVGTIFAEMVCQGTPLFPGDSEIDQIFKIFQFVVHRYRHSEGSTHLPFRRILGTPTEDSWPGVATLPDYKATFPRWSRQDLTIVVPHLDADGVDILQVSKFSLVAAIVLT